MAKTHPPRPAAADYMYQALVELMDKTPYDQITVTDITKKAGVSRMTFYRSYRSKDDILLDHFKAMLAQAGKMAAQVSAKEYWLGFIQAGDQDPIFKYIIQAGLLMKAFDVGLDAAMRFWQTAVGLDMTDEAQVLRIYQRMGMIQGYLLYLRDRAGKMSPEALAGHLAELMAPDNPIPPA